MFGKVTPTKERIYRVAVKLFSEQGYGAVSWHAIARAAKIQEPGLYHYFKNKKDILLGLYGVYDTMRKVILPNVDELLKATEALPPFEVIQLMSQRFPDEIEETVNRIIAIAVNLINSDEDSMTFVDEQVFKATKNLLEPVLFKMVQLERIEPMDIPSLVDVVTHYSFSAIAMRPTLKKMNYDAWHNGLAYIFRLAIKPTVE